MKAFVISLLAIVGLAAMGWLSDFVTLQGERTVYGVDCVGGPWREGHCTGRLAAGPRFRFRALKAHGEVLFWTAGASAPSGKLVGCRIDSGRDWRCPRLDANPAPITFEMLQGRPAADAGMKLKAYHAVSKWRWYLLRMGLPAGSDAEG